VRIVLVSVGLCVALTELIRWSSTASPSIQWLAWALSALCAVPWLANALAALWLLAPGLHGAPRGLLLSNGRPARIAGYGVARLALTTAAGWDVHYPYLTLAFRPLLATGPSSADGTELWLEGDWTEARLQRLRQAAILAPYRDLSSQVSLSRQGQRVRVRLALAAPGAQAQMQRYLEAAVADPDTAPGRPGS
jgi:hypothetical protein